MNLEKIISTKFNTVGLVKVTEKNELKRIPGFFNKECIKEAVDKYFDLFGNRDISLYFKEGDEGGNQNVSILLFRPDDDKDLFVAIAGKTEKRENVEDDF